MLVVVKTCKSQLKTLRNGVMIIPTFKNMDLNDRMIDLLVLSLFSLSLSLSPFLRSRTERLSMRPPATELSVQRTASTTA